MRNNSKLENLLYCMERAKNKGEPFVPYDIEELKLLTCHTFIKYLPIHDSLNALEGWSNCSIVSTSYPLDTLIDTYKKYTEESSSVVGITLTPSKNNFLLFLKDSND